MKPAYKRPLLGRRWTEGLNIWGRLTPRQWLWLLLAVVFSVGVLLNCAIPPAGASALLPPATSTSSTLLPLVNADRARNHAPPLTVSWQLEVLAMQRAHQIVRTQRFTHYAEDGSFLAVPFIYQDLIPWRYVSENLAMQPGYHNSAATRVAAESALEASPGHQENLIDPAVTYFGSAELVYGTQNGFIMVVFVQEFLQP